MLSIWNRFIFCCICIQLNKVQKCKISPRSVLFVVASCFAYLKKMQSVYQWYHICEYFFILAKYYITNWIFIFILPPPFSLPYSTFVDAVEQKMMFKWIMINEKMYLFLILLSWRISLQGTLVNFWWNKLYITSVYSSHPNR